ncbi:MAG: hypothetical protein M5U16_09455 [Hyphomicrobium sp.]|nr:hypothetical protein [Hyphomicrobium sp.]
MRRCRAKAREEPGHDEYDPTGKGMLSTEAARKSFFSTVVDLYKSDLALRGMVDFAVIGAVTLMFINPPHRVQWPWSDADTKQDTIRPKPITPGINLPDRTIPTPGEGPRPRSAPSSASRLWTCCSTRGWAWTP